MLPSSKHAWIGCLLSVFYPNLLFADNAPSQAMNKVPPTPNIIVILADDLGYADLSCYGNDRFQTPWLDQLASQGMRFTDFHSSGAVCSPTRAGLLTGRYQQRSGISGVINAAFSANRHHGLNQSEWTLAESLKKQGYATAVFGKWHLGYREIFNPIYHGFDQFAGYVSGNVDYHAHLDRMGVRDWWQNNVLADEPGYTTHLITRHALDFIREHGQERFLLYLAYEAPHDPYQGPSDPPIRVESQVVPNQYGKDHIPRAYREMVQAMDQGIGQVLGLLEELELDQNTLVWFLSDNGANRHGNSGPLRGFKGGLYEGGHRVPAIAWWPSVIPSQSVCEDLAISLDVMPTLLALTGASPSDDHPLDGVSLIRALRGGAMDSQERELYWSHGTQLAMRQGPWKLMMQAQHPEKRELYHLGQGIGEQHDLVAKEPERVSTMVKKIQDWYEQVNHGATLQEPEIH